MSVRLVISNVFISQFHSTSKAQASGKRTGETNTGWALYKGLIPSHNSKQVSFTAMADELEAAVFNEEKKKRKRRGPRLTGISKQRRMANARERKRVQNLNEEIEILKSLLPLSSQDKKPTKTEVIWLAAQYIDVLTQMLQDAKSSDNFDEDSFLDFDTLLGIDIDSLFELDGRCNVFDPQRDKLLSFTMNY